MAEVKIYRAYCAQFLELTSKVVHVPGGKDFIMEDAEHDFHELGYFSSPELAQQVIAEKFGVKEWTGNAHYPDDDACELHADLSVDLDLWIVDANLDELIGDADYVYRLFTEAAE